MEQTRKTPLGRLAPGLKDNSLAHLGFSSNPFNEGDRNLFNGSVVRSCYPNNLNLKTISNSCYLRVKDICDQFST